MRIGRVGNCSAASAERGAARPRIGSRSWLPHEPINRRRSSAPANSPSGFLRSRVSHCKLRVTRGHTSPRAPKRPRLLRTRAPLEIVDLAFVPQDERCLIEPFKERCAPVGREREGDRITRRRIDPAGNEIDGQQWLGARRPPRRPTPCTWLSPSVTGSQAVLAGVAVENLAEAGRNHAADSVTA